MILIGVCGFERNGYVGVPNRYIECVLKAGAVPIIFYDDWELVNIYSKIADGIVFVGGGDVSVRFTDYIDSSVVRDVDEKRDRFEIELCKKVANEGLPMLGICRGAQVINIALGGDVFEDIANHDGNIGDIEHAIVLEKDNILMRIFEREEINVNSSHHQACNKLAKDLFATAFSKDGIIEAFECKDKYIHGVQFHPERMVKIDNRFQRIFDDFIFACKENKRKRGK